MGRMIDIDDYVGELQKDGKYVVCVLRKSDFEKAIKELRKDEDIPEKYNPDYNEMANDLEQCFWDTTFDCESLALGQLKECIKLDSEDFEEDDEDDEEEDDEDDE